MTDTIYVAGQGRIAAEVHRRLRQALGVPRVGPVSGNAMPAPGDLVVAALDGCAFGVLEYWENAAMRCQARLFVVAVDNGEAAIGPEIHPARPGCVRCWRRHRFTGRMSAMDYADCASWHNGHVAPDPWLTPVARSAIALIATERILDLAGSNGNASPSGPSPVYCWDLRALTGREHDYMPDESCPRCGGLMAALGGLTLHLESRPKPHRSADRLRHIRELAAEIGARSDGRSRLVAHTNTAERFSNGAVAITEVWLRREKLKPEPCSGFAATYDVARTTSFLEALERYAGVHPVGRSVRASVAALGDVALSPTPFGLYSEDQYTRHPDTLVRYHDDLDMAFVWAHSLPDGRPRLIPRALAFYSAPRAGAPVLVVEGSNGCSLGSCAEEAIFHGLCEVLERDALLMTWLTRRAGPQLDVMASRDTETRARCRALHAAGYDVFGIDITNDYGIPAIWLMARLRDDHGPKIINAAACHLQPERALVKALRELSGMVDRYGLELTNPAVRERACWLAEDLTRVTTMNDHSLCYCVPDTVHQFDFLLASDERTTCERMSVLAEDLRSDDMTVEVRRMVNRIEQRGGAVIAVNQTRPEQRELGLCTYKTLVAGAIPIAWGADLQRQEGLPRLTRALAEIPHERSRRPINPAPHPLT